MLFHYLAFLLKSKNEHAVHSPFVFELYTKIIKPEHIYYAFTGIEQIRRQMLTSAESIEVQDFGAGSKVTTSKKRKIKEIARYAQKNAKFGQLLFRLVNHFQPKVVFDLGTSLGITTLYMASACKQANVYTFEGCGQTLAVARKNFSTLGISNVTPIKGNIDHTLSAQIKKVPQLDFVFFDANHRLEPTLSYFNICLKKSHEASVFVFDDIYWSAEMAQAWEAIKAHPAVILTIDLFYVGLVFFRKNQPEQHFVLRF